MTDLNRDLLVRTRDYIRDHPDEHEQSAWGVLNTGTAPGCQTTYCIAGHVCVTLQKDAPVWSLHPDSDKPYRLELVRTTEGKLFSVRLRAQSLLRLTDREANRLFYCTKRSMFEIIDDMLNSYSE